MGKTIGIRGWYALKSLAFRYDMFSSVWMIDSLHEKSLYYLILGVVLCVFHGANVSLDQFFAHNLHTFESVDGFKNALAVIIMSFVLALLLCLIVERAKKCLDFALTLYFIDFILCILYEVFYCTIRLIQPRLTFTTRAFQPLGNGGRSI